MSGLASGIFCDWLLQSSVIQTRRFELLSEWNGLLLNLQRAEIPMLRKILMLVLAATIFAALCPSSALGLLPA